MKEVLRAAGMYLAGVELSRVLNSIEINSESDLPEVTTFGAGNREYLRGFSGIRFSAAGFYDPIVDATLFAQAQSSDLDQVLTAVHSNVPGGVAIFFRGCEGQYQFGGSVGQATTVTLSGQTTQSPVVRGKLLARLPTATASGTGTAQTQNAVLATEGIYGALHVFAASGTTPSLTVKIQSDDNAGFSSPIDRLTFTAATTTGSQWVSAAPGAITDTYWRAVWTVSGTTPSFGFAVSFGAA